VTFVRDDGRRQTFRMSARTKPIPERYRSPTSLPSRALIGKTIGDRAVLGDHEIEVLAVE
jgi:transcription elongation GreA/GreB family factor